MNSTRLYPFAQSWLSALDAVAWIAGERYGVAPHRDVTELAHVVAWLRVAIPETVATHPDPHTRRVWRGLRSPLAALTRQLRLPPTHARNAQINTLCQRVAAALQTLENFE